MNRLFQFKLHDKYLKLYNEAITDIKASTNELLIELDNLISNYNKNNKFEHTFFLYEKSDVEKIEYLKKLRDKIILMNDCDKIKVKVATAFHPMCWAYLLLKKYPTHEWIKNYIMYGFCVPFYIHRPIMLAYYMFDLEYCEFRMLLAHELTHALMHTKDLNAENADDAINDAWTLCYLF